MFFLEKYSKHFRKFLRSGLSATFNDGGGISFNSSSGLSLSAGYVGLFAGNVTITGQSKVVAKKGGSIISLENDFYNNAGVVLENGSDRASNSPFDDDPQNGAAEAKAAMMAAIKAALGAISAAIQGAIGKFGSLFGNRIRSSNRKYKNMCYIS